MAIASKIIRQSVNMGRYYSLEEKTNVETDEVFYYVYEKNEFGEIVKTICECRHFLYAFHSYSQWVDMAEFRRLDKLAASVEWNI